MLMAMEIQLKNHMLYYVYAKIWNTCYIQNTQIWHYFDILKGLRAKFWVEYFFKV